jgi:hypothetical protein
MIDPLIANTTVPNFSLSNPIILTAQAAQNGQSSQAKGEIESFPQWPTLSSPKPASKSVPYSPF